MNWKFPRLLFVSFLFLIPCSPLFSTPLGKTTGQTLLEKKNLEETASQTVSEKGQGDQIPALLEEIKGLKAKQGEKEKKIQELVENESVNQTELESLDKRFEANFRINGYFDLKYRNLDGFQDGSKSSFDQSHTALFFQHQSDHWLFFAEMEWEHSGRKIKQERAWVKYGETPKLEVKMGHFLIPSYWNLNHYPTVATAISEPDISRKILLFLACRLRSLVTSSSSFF